MNLMLDSIHAEFDGKPGPILVDVGYWHDEEVPGRYVAFLKSGISRRNTNLVGYPSQPRLFIRVPPTKLSKIMARLPIVEGSTYWRATHHWQGLADGEDVAPIMCPLPTKEQ